MEQEPARITPSASSEAQWRRAEERFWERSAAGRSENRRGFFWIALALAFVFLRVFLGNLTFR